MKDKFENIEFENLLTDYFTENISENDLRQLSDILKTNDDFQSRFNEINKLRATSFVPAIEDSKNANYNKLLQQLDINELQIEISSTKNGFLQSSWFKKLGKIAAIIIFAVTVSIGTFYLTNSIIVDRNNQHYTETIVPFGSQTKLVLPDGSIAWLNSGSTLKYNQNFGAKLREVTLTGEGYFEVKKDADKPFIVHSNILNIKVLGTIFNVNSYKEDATVEVNLIEGSVNVTFQNSQNIEAVVLKPNAKLSYNKKTQQITTSINDATKSAMWKTGKLYFENETLENIVLKLERKYKVKILIDNQQIKKEIFSGNINLNNSLKDVFSYIDVDNKFIYKQEGDTFRIY